ncbi:MAG: FHA domain-containing protein [Lachnospiraceae bacterium]|nr:FHA domain-containing protein [Lachnospiraceae bacterium]
MKETMPEISFERSMNHNYMILSKRSYFGLDDEGSMDYRTKMLLENHIPGLLPVTHRRINGECRYYYEINSLQSLDRLYDKSEIRYDDLRRLLSGCVSLFDRLEEYLLDGTQIIIKSDLIYIDVEKMEPYFVCYPDYEGDVRLSFMEFIDELLTKIDHTDERAVMLGYQIYRYTRNPNYVISEIGAMMDHVLVDLVYRQKTSEQSVAQDTDSILSASGYRKDSAGVSDTDQNSFASYSQDIYATPPHDSCNLYEEAQLSAPQSKSGTKSIGDLIGGIFCIFVSLCAGAIILGARLLHSFQLGGNNELYLFGAMSMAIVAAILFLSCYMKKRRQCQEIGSALESEDQDEMQFYTSVGNKNIIEKNIIEKDIIEKDIIEKYDIDQYDTKYPQAALSHTRTEQYSDTIRKNQMDRQRCTKDAELFYQGNRQFGIKGVNHAVNSQTVSPISVKPCAQNETVYLGEGVVEERMLCGRMNGREVNISLDRLPMTVGKLANVSDFVIQDAAVSKMHARFEEHDGKVYLCDLNSTNGTVRNGELLGVNQSVALEPGDRLRFGRTCFTYC